MSTARWDLKEAAGKALTRRTGTAYEAAILDEGANRLKVRYLHGKYGSICSGYKREGDSVLPGEVCPACHVLRSSRGDGKGWQKSAEGIVGSYRTEGPNLLLIVVSIF